MSQMSSTVADGNFAKNMFLCYGLVMKYTTIITKEGKWYVSKCVELGVASQGKSVEEAQENLKEAIELYLDGAPSKEKLFSREAPFITFLDIQHA